MQIGSRLNDMLNCYKAGDTDLFMQFCLHCLLNIYSLNFEVSSIN